MATYHFSNCADFPKDDAVNFEINDIIIYI